MAIIISLFIDRNITVYFTFFGIQYIPQEVLKEIKDKSITHSIFKVQNDNSVIHEFYCIAFIEYMMAGKTLSDYTNLVFPNVF